MKYSFKIKSLNIENQLIISDAEVSVEYEKGEFTEVVKTIKELVPEVLKAAKEIAKEVKEAKTARIGEEKFGLTPDEICILRDGIREFTGLKKKPHQAE